MLTAYPHINNRASFDVAFDGYMEVLNEEQDTTLRESVWSHIAELKSFKREKQQKLPERQQQPRPSFDKMGKVKNKIVYARQDTVMIKDIKVIKFRDRHGRFVKVLK